MIIEDFLFFFIHKLLHTKYLYKKIHKIHHEYYSPMPLTAFYSHPLEFILSNIVPL